jgi:5'-nucleotidase
MRQRRLLVLTITLLLILALLPTASFAEKPDRPPKVDMWLTVLHNNDGESQLISYPGLPDFGGAARFKTLVDNLKSDALTGKPSWPGAKRGVVMVSSGDNYLAGPEFNASLASGVPFYDTIAMDLIGYDAVAIGNHDFDFGPDVLADFIEGYQYTQPPYVSANLDFSGEPRLQALFDQGRIASSTVVKERGEYIGIIGATTPNLPFISSPRNVIVDADVAGIVQAEVDMLESMGVDKIILISHLQNILEDQQLAEMLDGVDVMVAGGGDELLANSDDLLIPDGTQVFGPYPIIANDVNGTPVPVVTTSGNYGYVGRLVVGFDKDGNVIAIDEDLSGPVRVAGGDNPDGVEPDPMVQAWAIDPVVAYVADLAGNILGTSAYDLDGRRSSVRSMEANEGNLIADALFWQATELAPSFGVSAPDVALQNGGGIRNDSIVPAGPISELDTFDMVPFPNFVTILENIPRQQFKEILENAVACTQPDDFTANPNCGSGRFAQVSGLTFQWSASGVGQILNPDGTVSVPGTRIQEAALADGTDLVIGGAVEAGPDLTIATIDFLANGGDQYPYRGAPFTRLGATYQQALANYIVDGLGGMIDDADYAFDVNNRIFELP